jgi:hypothetical protein
MVPMTSEPKFDDETRVKLAEELSIQEMKWVASAVDETPVSKVRDVTVDDDKDKKTVSLRATELDVEEDEKRSYNNPDDIISLQRVYMNGDKDYRVVEFATSSLKVKVVVNEELMSMFGVREDDA